MLACGSATALGEPAGSSKHRQASVTHGKQASPQACKASKHAHKRSKNVKAKEARRNCKQALKARKLKRRARTHKLRKQDARMKDQFTSKSVIDQFPSKNAKAKEARRKDGMMHESKSMKARDKAWRMAKPDQSEIRFGVSDRRRK